MKRFPLFEWFANISIAKKLLFTIGTMAVLIALELFTLWFSLHTLSSVRASVGAEGLWSKAQKDAVYTLHKYAHSTDQSEYAEFQLLLRYHQGDKKAFAEIGKENPDRDIMRQGYLEGGIHPDDVEGTINLFLRFNSISYIEKAIGLFNRADANMTELQKYADLLHATISESGTAEQEKIGDILEVIDDLNMKFTRLESEFSNTMAEGARWLENLVLKIVFAIALTVEISGILLAVSVSRGISRGIDEIIHTSEKLTAGDFDQRATIYSEDEIGQLATSFNRMIDEVTETNRELEEFAFVASHDLQEPLRTISNFVGLLNDKEVEKTPEQTEEYMGFILKATTTMQALIKDLLDISRIGRSAEFELVDPNAILTDVTDELAAKIVDNDAQIEISPLPSLTANGGELKQLFQNLISNAIKFRQSDLTPRIEISGSEGDAEVTFAVQDNGIGIEPQFTGRIFTLFQRLHTAEEYPGTGIGLAICKKIVDTHRGKIWVEPNPGGGSAFYFTISKQLQRSSTNTAAQSRST